MATARQYWNTLKATRNAICLRMGLDFTSLEKSARAADAANLAIISVVVKALTDNGILTDAQLLAARDAALLDVWDEEPQT